ncbi:hypothetical protein SAMN05660297_00291 [Natronincola peptidivorans]|uniref:Uncharacterized protein n=1 Tax=Natronincola peptidivorans TaxID=426128 RepID=A0A1H9YLB9_9FIRM|nr:hypothetical protein [Natronincola peptidivorans]SES69850.1 hypothetical protein SAMN05660297_00291 [Natronincola peptidivorans]
MLYGYILIFYLVILLLGYSIGRRIGIEEGREKAINQTVIGLKIDYYNKKKCPICSSSKNLHKMRLNSEGIIPPTEL